MADEGVGANASGSGMADEGVGGVSEWGAGVSGKYRRAGVGYYGGVEA